MIIRQKTQNKIQKEFLSPIIKEKENALEIKEELKVAIEKLGLKLNF